MTDEEQQPEPPPPKPVITKTETYSKAVNVRIMSNGDKLFVCSWPGCNFTSLAASSVSSHYRRHSGQAARRRRGEGNQPLTNIGGPEVKRLARAAIDAIQELLDGLDAYEDEAGDLRRDAERFRALRDLVNDDGE